MTHYTARTGRSALLALAIGAELRRARGDRTQQEVARLAGIHRPVYARMERGHHEPTLSTLLPVLDALRADPLALLGKALSRAKHPGPPPPGTMCRLCPFFPDVLYANESKPHQCEHPSLADPGKHALLVFANAAPPTNCPRRAPLP